MCSVFCNAITIIHGYNRYRDSCFIHSLSGVLFNEPMFICVKLLLFRFIYHPTSSA